MCIDAKLSAGRGVLPMVFLCVTAYAPEDSAVYKEHCAQCHDKGVQRAPQLAALKALSPEKILDALTNGKIAEQGKALTAAEARAVAVFASGKALGTVETANKGACSGIPPPCKIRW